MMKEVNKEYVCECGRIFTNSQSFNGHRSHCREHLGEERYQKQVERQMSAQLLAIDARRKHAAQERERKQEALQAWGEESHRCEKCGKVMTEKFGSGRFCSVECANSKTHSDDTRLKIARSLKEFYANNKRSNTEVYFDFDKYAPGTKDLYLNKLVNYRNLKYYLLDKVEGIDFVVCPYCGIRMSHVNANHLKQHNKTVVDLHDDFGESCEFMSKIAHENKSRSSSENQLKLINEGRHTGWKMRNIRSYAELFWEKVLNNNKFQYQTEYTIKKVDIGIEESGCYFLDFLIDGYIDLEIDGKQHQYDDRVEHDMLRDERLKSANFVIYRIPWINPVESEKVKRQIDDFLSWYKQLDSSQKDLKQYITKIAN